LGGWKSADYEHALRKYGPLIVFGMAGSAKHAVVITGVSYSLPLPNQVKAMEMVSYADSGPGFVTSMTTAQFNVWIDHLVSGVDNSQINPLYLPQANPVQAIIYDQQDVLSEPRPW
jgi:hypothetical protein